MSRVELARRSDSLFKVYGKHVYGNLIGCRNKEALRNPEILEAVVREAAEEANMTVLDVKSWKIGEGFSLVAIILESHITVHTWPEYDFATVDVYSCGAHTDPEKAFEIIVNYLDPERVESNLADRSLV
ncbi:MAG: adenosylmethionine decarboxylase [Desulfurococcales archaeon]|nr:adenosylmethionine decarboxylase [Desulfurococcales archaeon]